MAGTIERRLEDQGGIVSHWSKDKQPCGWCGRGTQCIFDLATPLKGVVLSRTA